MTTPHEIPDKVTPVPQDEFISNAVKAWTTLFGAAPKPEQLACCLAQMVLESGRTLVSSNPRKFVWGKAAHNFNFGNIKSSAAYSWQYYECGEEVTLADAQKEAATGLVVILKTYKRSIKGKSVDMASVTVKPKHPWSKFAAYESAYEGIMAYMTLISKRSRYLNAWNLGVLAGNPSEFSHQLKLAGYYTATEDKYTPGVVSLFNEFTPLVRAVLG